KTCESSLKWTVNARADHARPTPDAYVPGAKFEDILHYGLARGEYADAIGRENEWLRDRLLGSVLINWIPNCRCL
ncbi:hypothetical protein, partial [Thiosulfatihalobacter marinus]|uniref:hypothetical protein n=1 Tax=Thiosulfatihalobacter marinus TaxID=2792481 RepID=UPI001E512809